MSFVSQFFDHENVASEIIDTHLGETLELRPMKEGVNVRPGPDTSRPIQLVVGTYHAKSRREENPTRIGTAELDVWFAIDERAVSWRPAKGDLIHRPRTGLTYRVFEVMPTKHGRTRYRVNHMKGGRT